MRAIITAIMLMTYGHACFAQAGDTWTKVRYNGGALQSTVNPNDWNNTLTVNRDVIRFTTRDSLTVEVSPDSVVGVTYSRDAKRHAALMATLGILVSPIALFGLFHKQRWHFIGIQWQRDGKRDGILIQGADKNYRAILFALETTTGKKTEMLDDEKIGSK